MVQKRKEVGTRLKKPYVRPEVNRVQLRPEEAVLGGCKMNGSGNGPLSMGTCNPFGVQCSTLGTS